MITLGWLDFAERVPGPEWKVNGWGNPAAGIVAHSAEGYEPYLRSYQSSEGGRRVSWHMSILYDGRLLQHYPITAQCWASGSWYPNNNFVAIEHEGIQGELLTGAQVATLARVIGEIARDRGWKPERGVTLWEHKECTRWGSPPTACPSGRIPWDVVLGQLEGFEGGDELSEEERQALRELWAKEVVLYNIQNHYRTRAAPDYSSVELLDAAGNSFNPPLVIPTAVPPWLGPGTPGAY